MRSDGSTETDANTGLSTDTSPDNRHPASVVIRTIRFFRENRAMTAIALATTISMMGQGVVAPVLPAYAQDFDVGTTSIGFVVAAFGFSRLFLNIPSGVLGAKYGRTVLMSVGLAITAVGNVGSGFAPEIIQLIAWRVLAGAGSAMFMTGAMAYVADISTSKNRGQLMSIQQGALLLGVDLGPPLGGFVADTWGLAWPFFMAGGLAAAAAIWTVFRLPNRPPGWTPGGSPTVSVATSQIGNQPRARSGTRTMLSNPTFLVVGLFTLMVFLTRTGSRQTLVPIIAIDEIEMSLTMLGVMLFVMTTINFFIVFPAGWLADRFGRKPVMVPGILLAGIGLLLFALAGNVTMMFIAAIIMGIGTGVAGPAPAAYIADLAPPGQTSLAMGLYRTFGDLGFVIGPIALGFIAETSGMTTALHINVVLLVGIGIILAFIAKETSGRMGKDRNNPSPKSGDSIIEEDNPAKTP